MKTWAWVYDPHSGGIKIPLREQEEIYKQVEDFSCTRPWYPRIQLKPRLRGQFCYIQTIKVEEDQLFPLCRLRHFDIHRWSLALFTYSNERYEPCLFANGEQEGTIEEALQICEAFII